jgi:hypothetical protein
MFLRIHLYVNEHEAVFQSTGIGFSQYLIKLFDSRNVESGMTVRLNKLSEIR